MKTTLAVVRQKNTGLFIDDTGGLTALKTQARVFETAEQAYQNVCHQMKAQPDKKFELVIMDSQGAEIAIDLC